MDIDVPFSQNQALTSVREKQVNVAQRNVCPACNSAALLRFSSVKNGYQQFRCLDCSTICLATLPVCEVTQELYDHYYDSARFTTPPIVAASLATLVRSFAKYRLSGRWLDIGYGEGALLRAAQHDGWACFGIEVSPASLKYGRDNGWVVDTEATEPQFPKAGFDVVSMSELVEHLWSVEELFALSYRLLRPGGILYVTTPNAESLNLRLLGNSWSVVMPPEHMILWSCQGLKKTLTQAGFRVIDVRTEGFNPTELVSRFLRAFRPGNSAPYHRNQAAQVLNETFSRTRLRRALKQSINQLLTLFRLGDRIKIRAVRR